MSSSIKLANTFETYNTDTNSDQRIFAPAASRNKQVIAEVLLRHLAKLDGGFVLEVACGTGEHSAHFAQAMPHLTFQPTDCTSEIFASVSAHAVGLSNILPPRLLDASLLDEQWASVASLPSEATVRRSTEESVAPEPRGDSASSLTALYCINMTHISPYSATLGLLRGAGEHAWLCVFWTISRK